jgi:hypothetical protein
MCSGERCREAILLEDLEEMCLEAMTWKQRSGTDEAVTEVGVDVTF